VILFTLHGTPIAELAEDAQHHDQLAAIAALAFNGCDAERTTNA
jgi:hypothetical protein